MSNQPKGADTPLTVLQEFIDLDERRDNIGTVEAWERYRELLAVARRLLETIPEAPKGADTLTDERIMEIAREFSLSSRWPSDWIDFARVLLARGSTGTSEPYTETLFYADKWWVRYDQTGATPKSTGTSEPPNLGWGPGQIRTPGMERADTPGATPKSTGTSEPETP